MPDAPLLRSVLLVAMASSLAACCASPAWTRQAPPPFGPGGPPPPPGPPPFIVHGPHEAFEAALDGCADELDLPLPSDRDDEDRAPPTQDDVALMDACLEAQGFVAPPPPRADRRDDPV